MERLKIYAEIIEPSAKEQIFNMAKSDAYKDNVIRIMPDCHAGAGCTVGTTMIITDKITPNLVGVDIGCTVSAWKIKTPKNIDIKTWFDTIKVKLDSVIHDNIPSGFNIRKTIDKIGIDKADMIILNNLEFIADVNYERMLYSTGTLGGGNHFISVEYDSEKNEAWLMIHCGSRNLGVQVCKYWQNRAINNRRSRKGEVDELIKRLKSEGREKEIQSELKRIERPAISNELAYLDKELDGDDFYSYLSDMQKCQLFAEINHRTIANVIAKNMGWKYSDKIITMHNYIENPDRNGFNWILRKGAVAAYEGQKLLIPMNMRDGSLICVGKGNEDWNWSAPHGAGRIMSRSAAKARLNMNEFKESMKDVYTTSVNTSTIDEAPMAYKPMEAIVNVIGETVDIISHIVPLYNFKASE